MSISACLTCSIIEVLLCHQIRIFFERSICWSMIVMLNLNETNIGLFIETSFSRNIFAYVNIVLFIGFPCKHETQNLRVQTRFIYKSRVDAIKKDFKTRLNAVLYVTRLDALRKIFWPRLDAVLSQTAFGRTWWTFIKRVWTRLFTKRVQTRSEKSLDASRRGYILKRSCTRLVKKYSNASGCGFTWNRV
jgi:hypothetical protein